MSKQWENEGTDTEANMEEQEEQPTPEVEVTADVTQENQRERPAQTEETKLDNLMTVSYTHLDVYKRQMYLRNLSSDPRHLLLDLLIYLFVIIFDRFA